MKVPRILTIIIGAGLIIGACAQPAAPTEEMVASPTTELSHLDRILENGKLLCATSADFPPMEFVDEDGSFIGFDMDFIREVGNRMGVDTEIWDMPFDSVIAALNEEKVDCVIAALAPTPERDEKVDFTNSYKPRRYVLMAQAESDVQLDEWTDAQNHTIGTGAGGIQVTWFEENWISEGLMPEENLVLYDRADNGISDLGAGRIDLYFTQDIVAQHWIEVGGYRIAAFVPEGTMGEPDTIIAVPDGAKDLQERMNEIIREMIEDGTRDEMLRDWGIPVPGD